MPRTHALLLILTASGCASLRPPPPHEEAPLLAPLPALAEIPNGEEVPAAPILAHAVDALGATQAPLARVRTEEIERHAYTAWQSHAYGDPVIEAARTRLLRSVDPAHGDEVLIERHRPIYPYPFPVEFDVREDLHAGHGYLRGADNALDPASLFLPGQERVMSAARVAMREKVAWSSSPYEIILAAQSGRAQRAGGVDLVHFTYRGSPMLARFDHGTGRLLDLQLREDDPLLGGDVDLRVAFDDWGDSGLGTVEPRRIVRSVDGVVTLVDRVVRREAKAPEPDVPEGEAPAGSAQAGWSRAQFMLEWMGYGFPQDDAAESPQVTFREIAPGVHMVQGGFHNSLVVELDGQRLALIEAPFSSERVEAILAEVERRFPGRRIDAVVQSHWHHDHSAGLRVAVARGLPIFAGAAGASMIERDVAHSRTLIPDALARAPVKPKLTVVKEEVLIAGSRNRVLITPAVSLHAQDMLLISVPEAKVLFVADELNPGLATPGFVLREILDAEIPFFMVKAGTYAKDLLPYLATHDIKLIVGGHGPELATPADVESLAGHADLPRYEQMMRDHAELP